MNIYQYLLTAFGYGGTASCSSNIGISFNGSMSFAIDAWVRIEEFMGTMCIIGQKDIFNLGIKGRNLYFTIGDHTVTGSGNLERNVWHYVSMYYYEGQIGLYIDGEEDTIQDIGRTTKTSQSDFTVGEGFLGGLRCVRIYDFPLTKLMMQENMYNEPVNYVRSNLNFAVNPPVDVTNHFPITLSGAVHAAMNGIGAQYDNFAYVKISQSEPVNPGGMSDEAFSLQAWVYWRLEEGQSYYTVFSNTDPLHSRGLIISFVHEQSGQDRAQIIYGVFGESQFELETEIQHERWMNIAVTYDKGTLKLFVDGEQKQSRMDVIPLAEWMEEHACLIGTDADTGMQKGYRCFCGLMGNLDIWKVALDEGRIKANMQSPPLFDDPGIVANFDFLDEIQQNRVSGKPLYTINELPEGEISEINTARGVEEVLLNSQVVLPEPFTEEELRKFRAEALSMQQDDGERYYFVTSHRRGERVYFIAHDRKNSYTIMHLEGALTIDDETIWWVTLFLIIIGGLLDVIASLRISYMAKLEKFVLHHLVDGAISKIIFRGGAGIGEAVSGIWKVLKYIVVNGLTTEIVKASIAVSIWTVVGIACRIAASLASGPAVLMAKLTYIGASILCHIANKPVSMNLTGIAVETVRFSHDESGTVHAVNIRKNQLEEWPDSNHSPAVYCKDLSWKDEAPVPVSVKVRFRCSWEKKKRDDEKIWLRAVERKSNTFGNSSEVEVNSVLSFHSEILVTFPDHRMGADGIVRDDISLEWQFSRDHENWTKISTTTHRIYVILSRPKFPWGEVNTKSATCLWTDALDFMTKNVMGIKSESELAAKITNLINQNYKLQYDYTYDSSGTITGGGDSFYTGMSKNDGGNRVRSVALNDFIKLLGGTRVNCSDCATLVATFANLYGCALYEIVMSSENDWFYHETAGFECNQVLAIGREAAGWRCPFTADPDQRGGFHYHEVACAMERNQSDNKRYKIYDACLKVNGKAIPWGRDKEAYLPVHMTFSAYKTPSAALEPVEIDSYREHLAGHSKKGVENCYYEGYMPDNLYGRRVVRMNLEGAGPLQSASALAACGSLVNELIQGSYTARETFVKPIFYTECIPQGYELVYRRGIADCPGGYMERYRGAGEDEWIYLEVIPCRSGETARLALVEKLLENACPGLPPRMESHKIDLGFESGAAGNYQKAFTVGNLYVYLRMAGPEPNWLLQKISD